LRNNIGLVTQEPVLFDCTIKENISYGVSSNDVPFDAIVEASKKANAHNFIMNLPQVLYKIRLLNYCLCNYTNYIIKYAIFRVTTQ